MTCQAALAEAPRPRRDARWRPDVSHPQAVRASDADKAHLCPRIPVPSTVRWCGPGRSRTCTVSPSSEKPARTLCVVTSERSTVSWAPPSGSELFAASNVSLRPTMISALCVLSKSADTLIGSILRIADEGEGAASLVCDNSGSEDGVGRRLLVGGSLTAALLLLAVRQRVGHNIQDPTQALLSRA